MPKFKIGQKVYVDPRGPEKNYTMFKNYFRAIVTGVDESGYSLKAFKQDCPGIWMGNVTEDCLLYRKDKSNKKLDSRSTCYLSDDFSKVDWHPYDNYDIVIFSPESLKNEQQINDWIDDLKDHPKNFATCSLYLLRELELRHADVEYVNFIDGVEFIRTIDINNIGNRLEILDRELRQCDRYLNTQFEN